MEIGLLLPSFALLCDHPEFVFSAANVTINSFLTNLIESSSLNKTMYGENTVTALGEQGRV